MTTFSISPVELKRRPTILGLPASQRQVLQEAQRLKTKSFSTRSRRFLSNRALRAYRETGSIRRLLCNNQTETSRNSSQLDQSNITTYPRPVVTRAPPRDHSAKKQSLSTRSKPPPLNLQAPYRPEPIRESTISEGKLESGFKNTLGLLVGACGSFFSNVEKSEDESSARGGLLAGGHLGSSQLLVVGVLVLLGLASLGSVATFGIAAATEWWDNTNLVQRVAPLYMISLLPYLDFLWKLQQSKPQASKEMVAGFAFILVFVVISTPVEMYAKAHLGHDVADIDPLHFLVQSLITITNFSILMAFRQKIKKVAAKKNKKQ